MTRKIDEQITEANERLAGINTEIARLTEEREKKVLADSDAGWPPDTQRIDAEIETLKADADRERESIAALCVRQFDEPREAKRDVASMLHPIMGFLGRRKNGDLEGRLAAARRGIAELEDAHGALAHKAVDGDPVATEKFRQSRADIEAARSDLEMIERAIAHKAEQDEKKRTDKISADREARKQLAVKIGQSRIELSEKLTGQAEALLQTNAEFQQLTAELIAVVPLHHPADPGLGLYQSEIQRFVADEIYRLEGLPLLSGEHESVRFPQPKRHPFEEHANQPQRMTPLVERLHMALDAMQREMATRGVWPSTNATKSNAELDHNSAIAVAAAAIPQI